MELVRRLRRKAIEVLLDFGSERECPLCGWTGGEFRPRLDSRKPTADSRCPRCGSLERHRLAFIALRSRLTMVGNTLHFAPEKPIENWLRGVSQSYLSCDLEPGRAMDAADIADLKYPSNSFDLIWCSHVLEHVHDDRAAISELQRVLTSSGTCVVAVPIWRRVTFEDPTIVSPEERLKHFGQGDHVRLYGLDIEDRLRSAGFQVEVITSRDFDPAVVGRHGLDHLTTREVFVCSQS